ncbi:hypothetical protein BS47DRAFT_1363621 [Hydnum rufescens UP504]|uniref:Uncharacterized protein n=1 Tax=Hydnum rufescens UP504 TaxID=1448309 RepID=A0A9P6ATP2_9AGAM|nr:hypothetical protein BS47DRAFT_1363621 [Hydnum rufescens UP504]
MNSVTDADRLRSNISWVPLLSKELTLCRPVFAIIAHRIPTSFDPMSKDDFEDLKSATQVLLDSLARVMWARPNLDTNKEVLLTGPPPPQPRDANKAIINSISFNGTLLAMEKSRCSVLQCTTVNALAIPQLGVQPRSPAALCRPQPNHRMPLHCHPSMPRPSVTTATSKECPVGSKALARATYGLQRKSDQESNQTYSALKLLGAPEAPADFSTIPWGFQKGDTPGTRLVFLLRQPAAVDGPTRLDYTVEGISRLAKTQNHVMSRLGGGGCKLEARVQQKERNLGAAVVSSFLRGLKLPLAGHV